MEFRSPKSITTPILCFRRKRISLCMSCAATRWPDQGHAGNPNPGLRLDTAALRTSRLLVSETIQCLRLLSLKRFLTSFSLANQYLPFQANLLTYCSFNMTSPINLQLGWPSPRLFPTQRLATAATSCLNDPEIAKLALIYGPDLGYMPLRDEIAQWLSSFYLPSSGPIPKERIAITGGASQNLASILQVFSDPSVTKRIWMVEPTYFLACTIFQDAGFGRKLRGVPENENGVDISFLEKALEEYEEETQQNGVHTELKPAMQYGKIFRHILYITPTFSNPSAKTYSVKVRKQLLALARKYDILVVSDDVYDFLRWPAEESKSTSSKLAPIPPRIVDLDRATTCDGDGWGNSISNGSFSKIVAPGVRVGWAEASSKMILRLSQK